MGLLGRFLRPLYHGFPGKQERKLLGCLCRLSTVEIVIDLGGVVIYYCCWGVVTDRFPHLQIIEDELFQIAQKRLMENKLESPNLGRTRYRKEALLSDLVYCMHCGKRLTVTRNVKKVPRADGTEAVYHRLKYICINKSSLHPCDGQRSYSVNLVDNLIRKQLQALLCSNAVFPDVKAHPVVKRQDELKQEIEREQDNLDILRAEVVEVLRGNSAFGSVLLNDLIQASERKLLLLKGELAEAGDEARRHKTRWSALLCLHEKVLSEQIGDLRVLPLSSQQEIAHALISRVELGRDRAVKIQWVFGGTAHLGAEAGS